MIYFTPPEGFKPLFEISLVFAEHEGKILLTRRQPWDSDPNLWDIPGGGIDPGENPAQAALREFHEESGIKVADTDLKFIKTVYERKPERDFVMNLYYTEIKGQPEVVVNPEEHSEFKWVTPDEAKQLPLLEDGAETIDIYLGFKNNQP